MSDPVKRLIRLFLRVLVAAVLLAWVFSQVDLQQFRETVKAARWHLLIGVWTLNVLFSLLQSYALQLILRRQACRIGLERLFAASCVTALYSLVLPGVLSTGVKWYILKRSTQNGSKVLSSMLYNQAMLFVVMVVIGLAALLVTNPTGALLAGTQRWGMVRAVSGFLLIGTVLVTVLLLNSRTGGPLIRPLGALLKPFPRGLQDKGHVLLTQIAAFQTAGWRFHLVIVLINLIDGLLVGLLIYLFAARAAGVMVGMGVLIWLNAVVFVLSRIPISIANLGVREVTLIGLLGLYGVDKSAAFLMSVVMFSGLVFLALLGAAYQLHWSLKKR